jgi:hypothetical protein
MVTNENFERLWFYFDGDRSNAMLKDICQRTIDHYLSTAIVTRIKTFTDGSSSLSIYYRYADCQMEEDIQVHHTADSFNTTHYIPCAISFE